MTIEFKKHVPSIFDRYRYKYSKYTKGTHEAKAYQSSIKLSITKKLIYFHFTVVVESWSILIQNTLVSNHYYISSIV